MLRVLLATVLTLCSTLSLSVPYSDFAAYLGTLNETLISVAPSRTVNIKGGMDETCDAAAQIEELSNTSGPIRITVDSPGGYVYVARDIVLAIQDAELNGNQVTCVAVGNVMSAAWIVFNACPRRQAYSYAKFMWHSVAVPLVGNYNILQLRKQLSYLEALQVEFNLYLTRELQIPNDLFTRWWTSEITITGTELSIASPRYMSIVKDR